MLSKLQKKEITDKIAEKFKNLPDEMDSKNYFDDPDNRKELVLNIALEYINRDPKIIFAELNERKELEIAPAPELIAKHGEKGAKVIAKKRAENYIEEIISLIKEILDEFQESVKKEETETSSPRKQEIHDKKVISNKDNLKKLHDADSFIYEEIVQEILEFARDSGEFTTSDLLPQLEEEFGDIYTRGTLRGYALKTLRYCQENDWTLEMGKRKSGAYIFKGKNVEEGLIEIKEN